MTLYMPLFRACTVLRPLTQLHAHLMVTGILNGPLASTKLIESYSQTGSMKSSRLVFDTFSDPDSFMWGVTIKCHVWSGLFQEAIVLYRDMLEKSSELNKFIFPSVLRACAAVSDHGFGKHVHAGIVKCGFEYDPIVETSLLSMYGEMGCVHSARMIFNDILYRDVVSWSSMISAYVQNGFDSEGLKIFREMVRGDVKVDHVIMLRVAEACGTMGFHKVGKSCHGYVIRKNIRCDHEALDSSLIAMYGKFGDLDSAEKLFHSDVYTSVAWWTSMISCYNKNGFYLEALRTFIEMCSRVVEINSVTLMNAVCSCARLEFLREGKSIHGYVVKNNVDLEIDFLGSSLIDLYASCNKIRYSHQLFDAIQDKHAISWNILISGYVKQEKAKEALSLFAQMLIQGIFPDSFSFGSALSASGMIACSEMGSQIHSLILKTCIPNEFVENALIDMYCKCGYMNSADKTFRNTQHESVVTWNSMMCGLSQNGYSDKALDLFHEVYAKNLEMDEVTFLSVIQACSNLGFIDKGRWIHHKAITSGVKNDIYIDTALMNMYARCGDLNMARRVFDSMKDRTIVSWSSMIGNYAVHGHIDDCISLFNVMVKSGIKPNDVTFMNILLACSHSGFVEQGKFYFDSMVKDFGITPSSEHYACLVDLLSRAGDVHEAYEVIKSMPLNADSSIWGSLVNGCRIHQRFDFLKNINRDLVTVDSDDSGYYSLLHNVFAEEGRWNESKIVKSKMKSLSLGKVHGCSLIEI